VIPGRGVSERFTKPKADWVVNVDEALRIVPQDLWDLLSLEAAPSLAPRPSGTPPCFPYSPPLKKPGIAEAVLGTEQRSETGSGGFRIFWTGERKSQPF
jgi:hypothetical protein